MDHRILSLGPLLTVLALGCDPSGTDEDLDPSAPDTATAGPADDPGADGGAELEPPSCDVDGLRALVLPVDPGDPDGETFTYYYQLLDRDDGYGPTVIHIPGGPGGTSIGEELALPENVDLVLTDPRGVGCNAAGAPHEADFYGTTRFASDVLAIVKDLALEDYVIYGHSYGTVLGTVIASQATREGLPPPRLVVLEGILGKAMASDDAVYRTLWPLVRDALPEDARTTLLADPPPLGRSRLVWGETITGVLSQRSPSVLFGMLSELGEGGDTSALEGLLDAIGGSPAWEDEVMMGLFRPVACTEIAEDSWFGFELVDGEVVPTINACDAIDLTAPFDAADWPIEAPILYIQGDRDPATAIDGARAHFSAQTEADRTFVTVHGIGHTPLSWHIAESCGTTVWEAILAGEDLGSTLEACGVDASIEHAAG